jgi:S1-C subfamily serine protease
MKKYLLLCTLSAMLGAVLAIVLTRGDGQPRVMAQPPAPLFEPPSRPAAARQTPRIADAQVPRTLEPLEDFTTEERTNIAVYEANNRGVVNITTRSARADALLMIEVPTEGAGSGSVLDKRGHILTNYHVVAGAREINVTLFDGNTYEGGLVGQDPVNDIAVLRIDAPPESLFPVSLGDSSRLRVGQKVYAIGNPFGLERTMTVGIVSSLNRSLPSRSGRTIKSIIQIDAALNRGNSGGPLMDSRGELIGMNTAIASNTGENTGVGFAIPITTIKRVVPQLIENGKVIRPDVGIARVYETEHGLVIATLSPGGPAEQAGLKGFRIARRQRRRGPFIVEETQVDRSQADLLVAVDGESIKTVDNLMTIIEGKDPGDTVVLTVIRDSGRENLRVTLGEGE